MCWNIGDHDREGGRIVQSNAVLSADRVCTHPAQCWQAPVLSLCLNAVWRRIWTFLFSWSIFLFLYSIRVALQFKVLLIDQILPFSSSSETRYFSSSPFTPAVFWLAARCKHIWTAGVQACSGIESTVQILNWINGRGWMLTWAFESLAMFNMSSHHDNSIYIRKSVIRPM